MSLDQSNSAVGVPEGQEPGDFAMPSRHRSAAYLFACHLEWSTRRRLDAYQELVAALDDFDQDVRRIAETLLRRSSPRPQPKGAIHFSHARAS